MRSCEPALRAVGVAGGVLGGVPSFRGEGLWRLGACPPPAASPQGGQSGSAAHVPWARVCGRGGPALSLWCACPARGCAPRGWREVVPGGGGGQPLTVVRGVWCGALSLSRSPVLGGGQSGPFPRVSLARVVWAWGPSSGPTACALASRRCALWGWREGVLGGTGG